MRQIHLSESSNGKCPLCDKELQSHSAVELSICYNDWIKKGAVINKEIYKRRFPILLDQ